MPSAKTYLGIDVFISIVFFQVRVERCESEPGGYRCVFAGENEMKTHDQAVGHVYAIHKYVVIACSDKAIQPGLFF